MMSANRSNSGTAEGYVPDGYVDIHCHCLPAIDDGPSGPQKALDLCRALTDDGISVVVATPHQLGRYYQCNDAAAVRQAAASFNELLRDNDIPLEVRPGADVRVDERICSLLEADKILTLADGGRYILLELPHDVFIDIEPLLVDLLSMGVRAVISHPERHPVIAKNPELVYKWLEYPAYLQITAGSLVGAFGRTACRCAWDLLKSGRAGIVATDAHDTDGRKPLMKAALSRINGRLGPYVGTLVCKTNPAAIVAGRDIAVSQRLLKCEGAV